MAGAVPNVQRVEYICGGKGEYSGSRCIQRQQCGKEKESDCDFIQCINDRTKTGIKELDRVLGGGIVQGSLVLVGGDPGIGKSTLLLQVCQKLAARQKKVLYISGEESLKQIKLRANRMGEFADSLFLIWQQFKV